MTEREARCRRKYEDRGKKMEKKRERARETRKLRESEEKGARRKRG